MNTLRRNAFYSYSFPLFMWLLFRLKKKQSKAQHIHLYERLSNAALQIG